LMLRFSITKSSMLYKLVSVGKADWIVFNDITGNNSSRWKCGAEVEVQLFTGSILLSSLGNRTVAGSNRSCISSTCFGIQII
jgi:hypothetical protein